MGIVSETTPRRRLATAERRGEILAAAAQAYASAPYPEVTVSQIATQAGASGGLVFHYFGNKADLYAAVVTFTLERLRAAQSAAIAALPDCAPIRERVRAILAATLEELADHPGSWVLPIETGDEPEPARQARRASREEDVRRLASLLGVRGWQRHTYALWGWHGFVDQACRHWIAGGLAKSEREPLIEAALGALEGALGDWAV